MVDLAIFEQKIDALHCHVSQMYEWLPYNGGYLDQVPSDIELRRAWLQKRIDSRLRRAAQLYRSELIATYGEERGRQVQYAEAFEACEYGTQLTEENRDQLFPF